MRKAFLSLLAILWNSAFKWVYLSTGAEAAGVAERSYCTSKVRSGSCEEIPHIQGKKLWLCFAGEAVKRYPMSKVRENPVRE